MPKIIEVLARNLVRIRTARKLTQTELARRLGVSIKTINQYEKGKAGVGIKTISRLAEVLGVEESDLVHPGEAPQPIVLEPSLKDALLKLQKEVGRLSEGDLSSKDLQKLFRNALKRDGVE